jgi:tRNA G18 (ribose-2'-O)-methylase SpoU
VVSNPLEIIVREASTETFLNFVEITDVEDPRIAEYRDVRERDLVGRRDLFVAEGEVVIRALIKSSRPVKSLLIGARRVGKVESFGKDLGGAPIYVADQPTMDRIAGFAIHRGMLALGARGEARPAASLLAGAGERAMVVMAVGIGNHDNMGALFRNAAAFGAQAVLLDETCCDPFYRKALRVSVGAALAVPFARLAAGEAPRLFAEHGFETIALTPSGEERLDRIRPGGRVALLLGSEGPGLPPALLAAARRVRIEMRPGFDSLNVAAAGAVAMHHVALALA